MQNVCILIYKYAKFYHCRHVLAKINSLILILAIRKEYQKNNYTLKPIFYIFYFSKLTKSSNTFRSNVKLL